MMVVDILSADVPVQLFSAGSFGGNAFSVRVLNGVFQIWKGAAEQATTISAPSQRCVIAWRSNSSEIKVYLNTVSQVATLTAASAGSFTGGEIGGSSGQAGYFNIREFALFPTDIGEPLISQNMVSVIARQNVPTTFTRRLVVDGDSLSIGLGATFNRPYWKRMGLPFTTSVYCHAITGQTLSDAEADAVDEIDPLVSGATTNLFLKLGTNDLVILGDTGATLYSKIVANCNERKLAGYSKIVLWTTSIFVSPGSLATRQLAANALLRADFTVPTASPYVWRAGPGVVYADYLVDLAIHPDLGIDSAHSTEFWLLTDGDIYHLTDAGYQLEGDILALGLGEVYGNFSAVGSGGAVCGGTGLVTTAISQSVSGGTVAGGSGLVNCNYSPSMSGGAVLNGSAVVFAVYTSTPVGGAVVSGVAVVTVGVLQISANVFTHQTATYTKVNGGIVPAWSDTSINVPCIWQPLLSEKLGRGKELNLRKGNVYFTSATAWDAIKINDRIYLGGVNYKITARANGCNLDRYYQVELLEDIRT